MYSRNDPRLRRNLNELSQTLETANESVQAGLFDLNNKYIAPCLTGLSECFSPCAEACFGSREEHRRKQRRTTRGRPELNFDFYDDWDDEEDGGLLGLSSTDELDRLLAGSGAVSSRRSRQLGQPQRQRGMNYGSTHVDPRRSKLAAKTQGEDADATTIPRSSMLGFMERLPFSFGSKNLKYRPSIADLQDHPGHGHGTAEEQEPLLNDDDDDEDIYMQSRRGHRRARSGTSSSSKTTETNSSRGDIFPSEDELDDAQPLDDEFAFALERRSTGFDSDAASGKLSRDGKQSRTSLQSDSSKSEQGAQRTIALTGQTIEAGLAPAHDLPVSSPYAHTEDTQNLPRAEQPQLVAPARNTSEQADEALITSELATKESVAKAIPVQDEPEFSAQAESTSPAQVEFVGAQLPRFGEG